MSQSITEAKAAGTRFEYEVMTELRLRGFRVYHDLYVPYRPGDIRTCQVDIVAIKDNKILAIECKNISGILSGCAADMYWLWGKDAKVVRISNPLRQCTSHVRALENSLQVPVTGFVVLQDGTIYKGEDLHCLYHLSDFLRSLHQLMEQMPEASSWSEGNQQLLYAWEHPTEETINIHRALINRYRNQHLLPQPRETLGEASIVSPTVLGITLLEIARVPL